MLDNQPDNESLRLLEYVEGYGDLIFEWDRSYNVRVYPEDESFVKEFSLDERSYNAVFDLIDECELNPDKLKE